MSSLVNNSENIMLNKIKSYVLWNIGGLMVGLTIGAIGLAIFK